MDNEVIQISEVQNVDIIIDEILMEKQIHDL